MKISSGGDNFLILKNSFKVFDIFKKIIFDFKIFFPHTQKNVCVEKNY